MKILVIEDHALVRDGLAATLATLAEGVIVHGAANFDAAIDALAADDFDLITLDLMLPGTRGQTALPALRRKFPSTPVLVLSALDDGETIARVMQAGAAGFVSKSAAASTLVEAVRAVLSGEIFLSNAHRQLVDRIDMEAEGTSASVASVARKHGLTAAQARVLEVLADGGSNRQIADVLGLTEGTVKIHVSAILRALKVNNRAEAALCVGRRRR